MGHLGVTLSDIDRCTMAELVELDELLRAGHEAEKKAREEAKRAAKSR